MRFSVIICTYNRAKYIYKAMESIALQNYPTGEYEIVLVNNNCTDNTEELCQKFQSDYSQVAFNYVVELQQGLSYARNRGIKESKGDILIFLDDDATAFAGYLQAYDDFFNSHPRIIAAGGAIYPYYETDKPKWISHFTLRLITGAVIKGDKICPYSGSEYPGGGNAAFLKRVFVQFGDFNVDLGRKGTGLVGAEEKDLFDRLKGAKTPFYYVPKAAIYHYIPESKLTNDYFNRLTHAIGVSERKRTLAISNGKFYRRLFSEGIKWTASFALFFFYLITFNLSKGSKLLAFRWNVTKGLLNK